MPYLEILPFLASSLIVVLLNYIGVSTHYQQLVIIFLVISLILGFNKFKNFDSTTLSYKLLRLFLILLGSLAVQLIVASSGGFYSPLVILLHIFTLALSFLLNFGSATVFLILSLGVLLTQIQFNGTIHNIFVNDPWALSLYILSFIIIIPLILTASKTYLVKDKLSRKLGEYLKITKSKEESFLQALSEATFITDKDLKIVSLNEAAEKDLKLSASELINKNLLDVLPLIDQQGQKATFESLSMREILADGAGRLIPGFFYKSAAKPEAMKVQVQIRPVVGAYNKIDQIIVSIVPEQLGENARHPAESEILLRNSAIAQQLDKEFSAKGLAEMKRKFDYLIKSEEDILLSQELEDHPISQDIAFEDIALLVKRVVDAKKVAATSVGVYLTYKLAEDDAKEMSYQKLKEANSPLADEATFSEYSITVDPKWLQIMVGKLIDISTLISSTKSDSEVEVKVEKGKNLDILVEISCFAERMEKLNLDQIFLPYYKELADKTNLKYGTGLEGYIAKIISSQLGIEIKVNYDQNNKRFGFGFSLSKIPQPH